MKTNKRETRIFSEKPSLLILLLLFAGLFFTVILADSEPAAAQRVFVNDKSLTNETVLALEDYYKIKVLPGRYWYDHRSGLWGIEGSPAQGIMIAGLDLGGSLQATASGGSSGVFINGREITHYELSELEKMTRTRIPTGRYWLAANGLAGPEGQPAQANLYQIAAQYYNQNNRSSFYRNSYTGIGSGGDGDTFYVIGEDFSYTN